MVYDDSESNSNSDNEGDIEMGGKIEDRDQINEKLCEDLETQCSKFATRFKNDQEFRQDVEKYTKVRLGYFTQLKNEKLSEEEFKQIWNRAKEDLAARLLKIYGHADANGLTQAFKNATRRAGEAYAYASWWINYFNAAPGIARSVALLGTQMAREFYPSDSKEQITIGYIEASIYSIYGFWQLAATVYAPYRQAAMQDIDVSRQVAVGPAHIPDVSPDQIVLDDGTRKPIREKRKARQDFYDITRDATLMWNLEDADIIDAELSPFLERTNEAKSSRNQALWELHRIALYTQMDVNERQSRNRAYRAAWNFGASVVSVLAAAASFAKAPSWVTPTLTTLGLYPLALQPVQYHFIHGRMAGEDYAKKVVSLFEIAAMTGLGDFLDKDTMKIVPARLDSMVKCPMMLRLDYARKILQFDMHVYLCAIIGHLLDDERRKGNRDVAFLETRNAFMKLSPEERQTRIEQIGGEPAIKERRSWILSQYEKCVKNSKRLQEGKLGELLADSEELGSTFKKVLVGSLKCAAGRGNVTPEDRVHERTLIDLKGDALRLSDLTSSHQTAQKWGQSGSYIVFGSAGFNIIKMIYSFAKAGIEFADPAQIDKNLKSWATTLAAIQASLQVISSYFAWQTGYAQHKNIALKNVLRGRDSEKIPIPNQGELYSNYSPWSFGSISNFKMLICTEIPKDGLPSAIAYERQTSTFADTWQQMKAASLQKSFLWRYLRAEGGSESPKPDPKAEEVKNIGLEALRQFYNEFTDLKIRDKVEKIDKLRRQAANAKSIDVEREKLIEAFGVELNVDLKCRFQPWRRSPALVLQSEVEKLNAELQSDLEILACTGYLLCLNFVEYIRCRANEFDPDKFNDCLQEAEQYNGEPVEKWGRRCKRLKTSYGLKTENKEFSIEKYLEKLEQSKMLDLDVLKKASKYARREGLADMEDADLALEELNAYIEKERLAYEAEIITTFGAKLDENSKVILHAISEYFAYPEKMSFKLFVGNFVSSKIQITEKQANRFTQNYNLPPLPKIPIEKGEGVLLEEESD